MANQPWDPKSDPIVGPGLPGTGTHQTRSGRFVDGNGNYINLSHAAVAAAEANNRAHGPSTVPDVNMTHDQSAYNHRDAGTTKQPEDVRAVQQFLVSHGYKIPVDGINGPLTKAAIANWTSGVKNRNPNSFNQQHGLASKPATADPPMGYGAHNTGNSPAHTGGGSHGSGSSSAGSATDPMALLTGMVTTLLKGGSPNQLLDPNSLSDAVAAPSNALAQTLQSELDRLPDAKKQALANIGNWFGQVVDSEKTAATRDQTMANNLSDAITKNTQGIAGGLGGSAMAGSGQINAVGANDANSMKAIGASDAQLADDLKPIFDLQKAGAESSTSGKFDQGKLDIQNQLAQALGQASSDKAAALMQIVGANNATRQQNFGNEADLLKTLASLQISGANAATSAQTAAVLNALRASEIKKNNTATVGGGFGGATSASKAKVAQDITNALVDTNSGKLKSGLDWPTALRDARNIVRSNGWNPLDPGVVKTIIGPSLSMAGITFQNPNVLYQP